MNKFLTYIILTIPCLSFAQSAEDDQITYQAALDWLDRKLNYYYLDGNGEKWWLNRFYVNENRQVTIKNIFTAKPQSANIKEKVYLIRKFSIEDINPYNMVIQDVKENQGRIVKGQLLELHTYGNQKHIEKTVDGRRASKTSFVHLSFPSFLTDSVADYAELIKDKLTDAIIASTKVYATGNMASDKDMVFEILKGDFKTETGQKFSAAKRFSNVYKVSIEKTTECFFGFDPGKQDFYLTTISGQGIVTKRYQLLSGDKLILQNKTQKGDIIEFETLHTFRMNNTNYYRE